MPETLSPVSLEDYRKKKYLYERHPLLRFLKSVSVNAYHVLKRLEPALGRPTYYYMNPAPDGILVDFEQKREMLRGNN